MRHRFRILAPVLAIAALVLVGGSVAFATAAPSSASLDAEFCYENGTSEYCYEIDGTIRYLDNEAGSSVTVNKITRTTVFESGQYAGETMSVTMSRGVFQADGTIVVTTVLNTRSTAGDEPCVYRMVLRLVDFEAVVHQVTATCV